MWRVIPILTLVIVTTALPAAQQDYGGLDKLIEEAFPETKMTPSPPSVPQIGGDLDKLIRQVFNNGSGVTLGINNQPLTKPEDCECVPYYQCKDGKILENGIGIIDIRSDFADKTNNGQPQEGVGPCENYLDVCCKAPNVQPPSTPPPTTRTGCGQRHPEGVGFRITGHSDNEAQFGEFPWTVAILKEEAIGNDGQKLNVYQCGGALIHRQAVLTAGHCVNGKQPNELKIRAGEWDTQTKNEIFPHQDRDVEKVIVHENYHSGALYNDYAILILKEPVDYADNVDIVCLPEANTIFDESRCFASGWGKDIFGIPVCAYEFAIIVQFYHPYAPVDLHSHNLMTDSPKRKEGRYQVILKRVDLPIVSHDTCQNILRTTRLGKYFVLHRSFICAGGEPGKDTCKGDGGSPLVCPLRNDPKRYVQAGIVAWGLGCGDNGLPGVYANIAYARQWIDEQMAFHNLDNTVYQYPN